MECRLFKGGVSINGERGFLPEKNPHITIQEDTVFAGRLNYIVHRLPTLLSEKKLRIEIDNLNREFPSEVLNATKKGSSTERNTVMMFLKLLVQAYIKEDINQPATLVPEVLTRNVYPLCKSRQCYPIMTYADYVLNNWYKLDENKPISLDNIEPIVTFTNTPDEAWFIKIHVVIEAVSTRALHAVSEARNQLINGQSDQLISLLKDVSQSLKAAIDVMHRMTENCRPDIFWDIIRPYLSGWNIIQSENGEVGVRLAGLNTKDNLPSKYTGASGAQSSIIPALDNALHIKHEINGMFIKLREFEEYMPREHRAIVMNLYDSQIRKHVKKSDSVELRNAYDEAVQFIAKFRGAHLALVHQYVFSPAKARGIDAGQIKGTGDAPMSYLTERYIGTNRQRI